MAERRAPPRASSGRTSISRPPTMISVAVVADKSRSECPDSPQRSVMSSLTLPDTCDVAENEEADQVDSDRAPQDEQLPQNATNDDSECQNGHHQIVLKVQRSGDKISELEQKRLVLRYQRYSLQRRIFELCSTVSMTGASMVIPHDANQENTHNAEAREDEHARYVLDMDWKCPTSGMSVLYSGPVNEKAVPHGANGIMKFADDQVYRGDVKDGMRWGSGSNSWVNNGQDYTGEWKANSRSGRGTHTWSDGRAACGEWRDGHLNGLVYFSWPNGAIYDGLCLDGKRHGRGTHTFADGRVYSGEYKAGMQHGFGVLSAPDGSKYRGKFSHGRKHGYGFQRWKTRTYTGNWEKGKPSGEGKVTWSNGATYAGGFKMGKYHGEGVYTWASGKKFTGNWNDGLKDGKGIYEWPNGKRYDGFYQDGFRHGYGRMQWADGSAYCGRWTNGMRNGHGIQYDKDGKMLHCGKWVNDVPHKSDGSLGTAETIDTSQSSIEEGDGDEDDNDDDISGEDHDEVEIDADDKSLTFENISVVEKATHEAAPSPDQKVIGEGKDLCRLSDVISVNDVNDCARRLVMPCGDED